MKALFTTLIFIVCLSFQLRAQNTNTKGQVNSDSNHLLGKINLKDLQKAPYSDWFSTNYSNYKVNLVANEQLKSNLSEYNITLFMGTWCGDSKREVPRLIKILESADYPLKQLTIIGLSRKANMYKQSPQHEEAGLNIHRVPTVIFYKNNKEINRIIEKPVTSLEEDILKIITTNSYRPNYQIVTKVNEILLTKGSKGLTRKSKKILKQFGGKVTSRLELNTYGRVLYTSNKVEEAIAIFELNTKLFPNEPQTYMSLANTLGIIGQKKKAISVLEKAVSKFPKNKDLKETLDIVQSN